MLKTRRILTLLWVFVFLSAAAIAADMRSQVRYDSAADRSVSITLRDHPLEAGLKQLVRGLSYAMFYEGKPLEGSKPSPPLLIALKVLPQGKGDSTALAPVVTLEKEARARALAAVSTARPSGPSAGYSARRWQMRLDRLPEATRQRLEEHVRQHQALREKLAEKQAEQRAEWQAVQQERLSAIREKAQQIWGQRPESDQTRPEDVTRGNSW